VHKVLIIFLIILFSAPLFAQQESEVYKNYSINQRIELLKTSQSDDYAVGLQVKGKLANVLTNFGEISSFHVASPSLEWPAFGEGQDDEQQYGWGINLMMGYNGDVIESFQDPASNLIDRDWHPADEDLFSGNVTVSEDDLTPIMATSDNRETWPLKGGEPFWPGIFRGDTSGTIYTGEFTSERDLYSVYTDNGNQTPYGIRVEQTAYSFARRYAEDFLVYRFNIKNTSDKRLEDLYPGMMAQFLIDFDNHDLIDFIDTNNDGQKDFIYMWDQDNSPREPWSKVGYIGLLVVNSPNQNGITNFHYFHDDFIPSSDDMFWRLLTSDTTGLPDTTKQIYFHGDNINLDDISFAPGLDPEGNEAGAEITWSISSGPVTLAPGDSIPLEIAIVCGDNLDDLLANVNWIRFLANNAWNGSNPPDPPTVEAFSDNKKVAISWDDISEKSKDNINGLYDFEGYKVYRSSDRGVTWGRKITDNRGNFIGFEPVAQFDLDNTISGADPISNSYLGNNSGLNHTFVDTNVVNGLEYWYTVTAYDQGDAINQVESLESALGLTVAEKNVVSAIPVASPSNFDPGLISAEMLRPDSGITDAEVSVEVIDTKLLKDRNYKINFTEKVAILDGDDTLDVVSTLSLSDADTKEILIESFPISEDGNDNIPVVDGFKLKIKDSPPGTISQWTHVNGDTSTFRWDTMPWGANDVEVVYTDYSFKIVIDTTVAGGLMAPWYDLWLEEFPNADHLALANLPDSIIQLVTTTEIHLPLKVYMISFDDPIDVSNNTQLGEFLSSPFGLLSPIGWDLIPGGAGQISSFPFPDRIIMEYITADSDTHGVRLVTDNGPAEAIPPSHGDEYTIRILNPISENVVYTFSTQAGSYNNVAKDNLEKIKVVPNPFFVTSSFDDQVMFTNLPGKCEIKIYNVVGDLIRVLHHSDLSSSEFWDLKNQQGLDVAYGLYVYLIKSDSEKRTGKFSIIR